MGNSTRIAYSVHTMPLLYGHASWGPSGCFASVESEQLHSHSSILTTLVSVNRSTGYPLRRIRCVAPLKTQCKSTQLQPLVISGLLQLQYYVDRWTRVHIVIHQVAWSMVAMHMNPGYAGMVSPF
jgi:hypothetical protein